MKIYLIRREGPIDYDTYDSAIVRSPDEETARSMHPGGKDYGVGDWCSPSNVFVDYIGEAEAGSKAGVVLASYNAG